MSLKISDCKFYPAPTSAHRLLSTPYWTQQWWTSWCIRINQFVIRFHLLLAAYFLWSRNLIKKFSFTLTQSNEHQFINGHTRPTSVPYLSHWCAAMKNFWIANFGIKKHNFFWGLLSKLTNLFGRLFRYAILRRRKSFVIHLRILGSLLTVRTDEISIILLHHPCSFIPFSVASSHNTRKSE